MSLLTIFNGDIPATTAPTGAPPSTPNVKASSGQPYNAASTGRRTFGWNASRLGPSSTLWLSLDMMRARSRDAVRNNPYATSAIDNFEAQSIGNGIRPHWNMDDLTLKTQIETEFRLWAESTECSADGMLNFYGMQALAAREVFEAGEVLARKLVRPASFGLSIPLQIQMIEGEQMPEWRNIRAGGGGMDVPEANAIRTGIEFDQYGRRAAYHLYKENPGESALFSLDSLTFLRIPASEMLHCYKPLRAGQLRGQPMLASVLGLLMEIESYTDAALVKKKIQTMFAMIVKKVDPADSIIPPDVNLDSSAISASRDTPPYAEVANIETGSVQYLLPGEDVTFPTLPTEADFAAFMTFQLHKFAAGVGMPYEMLTTDLDGVTYSSIRAGLIEFRRRCEQFQRNIMCQQFCQPIALAFLMVASFTGRLKLPGFRENPRKYTDITWSTPGWAWVDPLKDVQSTLLEIRGGLTSRTQAVAELGSDAAIVDAETKMERERADKLGIVYDSDPDKVNQKGTQPPASASLTSAPDEPASGKSGAGGNNGKALVKTK